MGGRQSLAPRAAGNMKIVQAADPRPIREDRQLLARMEGEVQDFLDQTGFQFPAKYGGDFHMPSQVLFMTAFRHMYHQCIDLKYIFNAEPKKEVEEVLQLLGDIKYPFLTDLSKTKLAAPGSIHNWPPVVGMLHWMLCIKVRTISRNHLQPASCLTDCFVFQIALDLPTTHYHGGPLERPVSDEDDDTCHYFPYLWLCYEQFWESRDEYPEERERLEGIFDQKSKQAREELEQLRRDEEDLRARLEQLQENESPLQIEETEKTVLETDIAKFIEYREEALIPRIKHYDASLEALRKDIEKLEEKLQRFVRERDALQKQVDAQNVSINDFEQMSRQREILAEQLKQIMARLQEHSSTNGHLEIQLSNKQSRVEEELERLSDKCRELSMFPYILPDGNRLQDFVIVAGNTSTMLPEGLDLGRGLKGHLQIKREELGGLYKEVTGAKIKEQEEHDVVFEEVEEKREELIRLDVRLKSVKEKTDIVSAAGKEESRLQAELEASNEIAFEQIDQVSRNTLDQAESKLQSAKLQINMVRDRDEELREQLHQEYVAGLETILSLKQLVTEGLKSLEEATKTEPM
jgi:kinetochore protein NDC80